MQLFKCFVTLSISLIIISPIVAQETKDREVRDANGNLMLEERYHLNEESVVVGSVKKEYLYDNENRKLLELTYFWNKEDSTWSHHFKEEYEYTDVSVTEKHYKCTENVWIPTWMQTMIDDKSISLKERINWNWDKKAGEWQETMRDKRYVLNDSLVIEEAYTRDYETNEYFGERRTIRSKRKYAHDRSMLIKDEWDREEEEWSHDSRSTSWNYGKKPFYDMIEFYDEKEGEWVNSKKVESLDLDNRILYVDSKGKWIPSKRIRTKVLPDGDEHIILYVWDKKVKEWEKYYSKDKEIVDDEPVSIYSEWNEAVGEWQPVQRSLEYHIFSSKKYNVEKDRWEKVDPDDVIRFDEKYSFDIFD